MDAPSGSTTDTPGPSRARRAVFAVAVVALAWASLELFAWTALWVRDGRTFRPARGQRERARVLAERSGGADALAQVEIPVWMQPEVLHPYLGFVTEPAPGPGSPLGFPDSAAVPERRRPDRLLVAVFGGSVAEGFAETGGSELVRRLSGSPALRGRRVELRNFALGGYKEPQQLMLLNYLLALGGELDVVIDVDGFNEVALHEPENARKGVAPIYPRSWYFRVARAPDRELQNLIGRGAFVGDLLRANARFFSREPLPWSPLAHLVWDLGNRALVQQSRQLRRAVRRHAPAVETSSVLAGPPFAARDDAAVYGELAAIWARSSLQFDRLSRANGIRYYQFLQPNQYGAPKPMGREERERAWSERQPYRPGAEKGYPLLRAEGRQLVAEGVRFEDLSEIFSDLEEPIYTDDCCHFNERGHLLLAGRIADAVLADLARTPLSAP